MSKLQIQTFPEFTEDGLNRINLRPDKNFKFKGEKKF